MQGLYSSELYTSEPLGDYFAGPNHILPTNGTAKFFSPLSVDDFVKKSSIISYTKEALPRFFTTIFRNLPKRKALRLMQIRLP